MAGARAYVCVYCHDLDRSHAINDVTKSVNGHQTSPATSPTTLHKHGCRCYENTSQSHRLSATCKSERQRFSQQNEMKYMTGWVDAHIKHQDSNGESGDEVEAEEEVDEEAQ